KDKKKKTDTTKSKKTNSETKFRNFEVLAEENLFLPLQHHQYPETLENLKFKDGGIDKLNVTRSKFVIKSNPSNEQKHKIQKQKSKPRPSTQKPSVLNRHSSCKHKEKKKINKSTEKKLQRRSINHEI
ncbi:hypothetical protein TorRG33x02_229230, partial [Trema orientale]